VKKKEEKEHKKIPLDDHNNIMNHPQIVEPMIPHNHEEEDRVQRSDDKNVGNMDRHPQESQVKRG
jgi:hypothetical protein